MFILKDIYVHVVMTKIARVFLLQQGKTNYITHFSSVICKNNFTIELC